VTTPDRWGPKWFEELTQLIGELPSYPDDHQAEIRRQVAKDPIGFAVLYFSHHLSNRATGEITFSEVHFEWAKHALRWAEPITQPMQDRQAFIAPRESGKSTWWFMILPIWAAANGYKKFAVAFAHSSGQAEGHLSTLKGELDSNVLLRHDYPDLVVAKRRPGSGVTLADRQGLLHTQRGFVFAAKGADTQVLGLKVGSTRPDLLILDDCEPDESNYSAFQAEKRLSTVTDAIFPLNVYASVVMVGTVTMPGSITHQLVKHAQGVPCEECQLGICWVSSEKIEAHHYRAILTDEDGIERSIWPEQWPITFLKQIRHTRSYGKNYDNDPLAREGSHWLRDDFRIADFPCAKTALFIDPAVTGKKSSDFTGLNVIGFTPRGVTPDLNQTSPAGRRLAMHTRKRLPPGKCLIKYSAGVKMVGKPLANRVSRILADHPEIRVIVIEVNQGGDLWIDVFKDVLCANGDPVKVILHSSKSDKENRFGTALEFFQTGYVFLREHFEMLEGQAVAYPRGQYDDVLDSACQGVNYWLAPDRKVKVRSHETSYLSVVA
jgi:hypothetical protein